MRQRQDPADAEQSLPDRAAGAARGAAKSEEGSAKTDGRTMNIQAKVLAAIDASGLPDRKLSVLATGQTDTVRNLRRGATPRADNLERLCHAMGLNLEIVPAPKLPENDDIVPALVSPTAFTENRELPVYEWTDPSNDGYLRRAEEPGRAPAPSDISDEQAFYVRMPDNSMTPAEIRKDDYCLVSPFAPIQVDRRVWVRTQTGQETIKWALRFTPDGFHLGAWGPGKKHHLAPAASFRKREDVVERGVVIAVYREQPAAAKILEHADWRPGPLVDLWRSAQFSVPLKATTDRLDHVMSVVENLEKEFKRLMGTGELSDSQARLVLRAFDQIIHEGREPATDEAYWTEGEASRT